MFRTSLIFLYYILLRIILLHVCALLHVWYLHPSYISDSQETGIIIGGVVGGVVVLSVLLIMVTTTVIFLIKRRKRRKYHIITLYSMAGNFRGVLIFIIFVLDLAVMIINDYLLLTRAPMAHGSHEN